MRPRVVSVPATHPYIVHATGHCQPACVDPWDVDALERAHVDIVHVHFGFETRTVDELERWADDLARAGIVLVHTVHDLDNPHLEDQSQFHRLVEVLVRRADAVLTLTDAARRLVADRHGRDAEVIAHPHVVPADVLRAGLPQSRMPGGVYVHAATMRPNLDLELIAEIAGVASSVGGLTVHVRDTVSPTARCAMSTLGDLPSVFVDVEPRLTDHQLWARLAAAAVVVLPYRWGTHSGLLEAAHDLGVPVAAPPIGGLADQGAHLLDRNDLVGSIPAAAARRPTETASDRLAHAARSVDHHACLYATLRSGQQ